MSGWQPISTAPRDGTRVLVYSDCGVHAAAYSDGFWSDGYDCYGNDYAVKPTHWMPLPPPPKEGA